MSVLHAAALPFRIGQGYDCHALVEGRKLIIGGVTIPHSTGLLGHSDADVLLHAPIHVSCCGRRSNAWRRPVTA
jgi:2-C-methyl-D-erythritol 2,4-cyclodiphosphate synthase